MRPVAILLLCLFANGCGSVAANDRCQWPERSSSEPTLIEQVQLAEDLAIRFADAHGQAAQWRANRESCEAALFKRLAEERGISVASVLVVRRSLEKRPFDWVVNLPMGALTVALGWLLGRWASRRFAIHEGRVAWLAVGVGAMAIAIAIVAFGQVWAAAIETFRIGNGHLSYRALRIPWQHHRALTFSLAIVTVLIVRAIVLRGRRRAV